MGAVQLRHAGQLVDGYRPGIVGPQIGFNPTNSGRLPGHRRRMEAATKAGTEAADDGEEVRLLLQGIRRHLQTTVQALEPGRPPSIFNAEV